MSVFLGVVTFSFSCRFQAELWWSLIAAVFGVSPLHWSNNIVDCDSPDAQVKKADFELQVHVMELESTSQTVKHFRDESSYSALPKTFGWCRISHRFTSSAHECDFVSHSEEVEQVRNGEKGFLLCGQRCSQQIWKVLHIRESCAFCLSGLNHRHSCQQQPVAVCRITRQYPAPEYCTV